MKNYAALEQDKRKLESIGYGFINAFKNRLTKAFNKGYEQGYNDCKVEQTEEEAKAHYDEGYKDGYEKGINEVMTIDIFEGIKLAEYNKGYSAGYRDAYEVGKKDGQKAERMLMHEPLKKDLKEAYQKGLKHGQELRAKEAKCAEACGMKRAWNVARKIVDLCSELTQEELGEIFGSFDVNDILNGLSASEAVSKLEAWEKKHEGQEQVNHEKLDYVHNFCSKRRNCLNCPLDIEEYKCGRGSVWDLEYIKNGANIDKAYEIVKEYEKKQDAPEDDVKVGDKVRTLKDRDYHATKLFPIGTVGRVVEILAEEEHLPYKIEANNDYWWYSRDMFEVIKEDAPDGNIEVGDAVRMIGSDPKLDNCDYGVCTMVKPKTIYVMRMDGSVGEEDKEEWEKTGDHYNIQHILDQMKEHEVEE